MNVGNVASKHSADMGQRSQLREIAGRGRGRGSCEHMEHITIVTQGESEYGIDSKEGRKDSHENSIKQPRRLELFVAASWSGLRWVYIRR
jgi:hypothetical protein